MNVAIARPVPARNNTAFQTQADVYKYMSQNFSDVEVEIIAAEQNDFEYTGINTIDVPQNLYERAKYLTKKVGYKLIDRDSIVYPDFDSLSRVIRERDYDIVETSDPTLYPYAYTAMEAAKDIGATLVCGSSVTKDLTTPIDRRNAQEVIDYASTIICPTPLAYDRFKDLDYLSKNDDRVLISGYPIDHNKFRPGQESKLNEDTTIVSVGRLERTKGFKQMARAIDNALDKGATLQWEIVGGGKLDSWLREFVEDRGIEEAVQLHGKIDHDQIPQILSDSDIFLLHSISTPSWEEYFGVAYAEAMSAGLPIIGSESGAIPWVVRDGVDGILVEEENVSGIESALCRLCGNEKERERMGTNGRNRILEEFSIDAYAKTLYEDWKAISR